MATQLHLIRHAKTTKLSIGATDDANNTRDKQERHLTDDGKAQATERRQKSPFLAEAKRLIVTPALRTRETGEILCGKEVTVDEIDELYPNGSDIGEIFNRLGYSTLETYYADPNGHVIKQAGQHMASIMDEVVAMNARLHSMVHVGHAVIMPAMAVAMIGEENLDKVPGALDLLSVNLGECEGITLSLDDKGKVTSVEFIR